MSQVYRVEQIKKPLENYRDIDAFKIYVSDLGLLCAKKDLAANDILYMVEELNDFKGGMTENYVNVQLAINGYNTYYWESERGAEIDFVIQRDGQLIPIEVKSADNTRAKSLKVYMDTYKPAYAIKLSAKTLRLRTTKGGSALCGVLYLNCGHTDKNSITALLIEISVMWFFLHRT